MEHVFEVRDLIGVPLADALDVLLEARATKQAAEAQEAVAILHIVHNYHRDLPDNPMPGRGRLVELAAEGGPRLNEFVPLELSAAMGMSQQSVTLLVADLLDLECRHPLLWQQARHGWVPLWQARKIAARASAAGLGRKAAGQLDAEIAPLLPGLSFGRAMKLVEGLIAAIDPAGAEERAERQRRSRFVRFHGQPDGVSWLEGRINTTDARLFDSVLSEIAAILKANGDTDDRELRRASALGILATPARAMAMMQQRAAGDASPADSTTADPRRLLPTATLFVHVSDRSLRKGRGVARVEGIGPVPVKQLRRLLGDTRVRVLPVFDPGGVTPVDCYEIPSAMRRAVVLRHPADVFPYGSRPSRQLDLDHTDAYQHRSNELGQTRVDNLGPLSRRAHRAKTHGGWSLEQTLPGRYLWRSPLGRHYWVSGDGRTYPLPDEGRRHDLPGEDGWDPPF